MHMITQGNDGSLCRIKILSQQNAQEKKKGMLINDP